MDTAVIGGTRVLGRYFPVDEKVWPVMGELCGWLGGAHRVVEPEEILARMGRAFGPGENLTSQKACQGNHGLWAGGPSDAGPARACQIFTDGAIWAAIEGNPQWLSDDIAEIARRGGHAEALAVAYQRMGRDLFGVLQGSWALAVLHPAAGRALVAIDRLGIRPMCFATPAEGGLVFGSTTTAVGAHPGLATSISPQALFDYLYFTRIPAPQTVYREIGKLLPGQYVWYEDGHVTSDFYWKLVYSNEDARPNAAEVRALSEELMEILRRAVERASAGGKGTNVGTYLSGGIDSSTVTGVLADVSSHPVTAFTVGFDVEGYNEVQFANDVARHFGADHKVYDLTPRDVIDIAPLIAKIYDEPFGNSSAVPAFCCARLAKENGIDILLAGDGGDELFAGNTRYADQRIFEAYGHIPGWLRRNALEPFVNNFPGGDAIWPVRKARSYIKRATTPLPDRTESYNYFNDVPPSHCFTRDIAPEVDPDGPIKLLNSHYREVQSHSALNRMMHLDMWTTLADDDLRKVARTAEAAGVFAEYPLLDQEVVEFSARVPPSLKLKGLTLRYFFKHAMRDFLPKSTLQKKKQGFGLPFGSWMKTDPALRSFTYDSIEALKGRDIFTREFLDTVVEEHRTGHDAYYGELVWILMILELWMQHHIDDCFAA